MANPFTLAPSLSRPSNSIPKEWDPILSASPPSTDTPHPQNSRLKDLARLYNAAVDDFTRVCARHARAVEARDRLNEDGVPTEVADALKDLPPLDGEEETNEDVLAAKRAFDQALHAARSAASTLVRARADARVRRGGAALEGDIDALVGGFKEKARGAATGKREEEGKFEEWVGLAAEVLRRRMENVRAEAVN